MLVPRYKFCWYFLLVLVVFTELVSCQRQSKYKGRWRAAGSRSYFFSSDREKGWEIARICGSLQATLVVFNSQAEYERVRRIKVPGKDYWIGLVHDPGESLLQWDDASYPNYLNNRGGRFSKQEHETGFYIDKNRFGWKYQEYFGIGLAGQMVRALMIVYYIKSNVCLLVIYRATWRLAAAQYVRLTPPTFTSAPLP